MNFTSKLSDVLKLFLRLKNPVSDDTSLQRLLDLIHDAYTNKPDETGRILVQFLQSAVQNIELLEPSIVTFALSVCGIAAAETSFYKANCYLVCLLYKTVNKKRLIDDPSIGTAYFKSLTLLSQKLQWLSFEEFIQDHIQEAYFTIKGNGSLFHQSAARQFLVATIGNMYTAYENKPESNIFLETLTKTLADDFMKSLHECSNHKDVTGDMTLNCLLDLWTDMLADSPQTLQLFSDDTHQVGKWLLQIYVNEQNNLQTIIENLLIKILNCCKEEERETILSNVVLPQFEDGSLYTNFLAKHKLATELQKSVKLNNDYSTRLKRISHLPLLFLFHADTVSKNEVDIVGEIVCKKPTFVKLLLQSVDIISRDPDSHEMIVSLLACTDVNSKLEVFKCPHIVNLIGNTKLQLKLMSTIIQLADTDMLQQSCLSQVVDVTLNIISQPQVDAKMYEIGQNCALSELSMMSRCDKKSLSQSLPRLTVLLEKRLVDTQWEIRDTAIEGIKKLIIQFKDNEAILTQMADSKIVESAWKCYTDTDSYVRASSFSLLAEIVKHPWIWTHFVTGTDCHENNLLDIALNIIATDSEAFARRAAVDFIHSIYLHRKADLKDTVISSIITGISLAIDDFDWEVKCKVLKFIVMLIDNVRKLELKNEEISGRPSGNDQNKLFASHLSFLAELGCLDALFKAFHDFDHPVQEDAYTVLNDLKKCISQTQLFSIPDENEVISDKVSLQEDKLTKFLKFLQEINFEEKLEELTSSVDEYVRNPISLLDDILRAESVEVTEENAIDCY